MKSRTSGNRHSVRSPHLALLVLVLGLSACSGQEQQGFTRPPTPVEIAEVKQTDVVDRFETVGTLEAAEAITVVAEIDATVTSLPFSEGRKIDKGGLIAQLDDAQIQAEVESARASRDQAKVTYERTQQIIDANAASGQELDDAAARLKIAQARLEQVEVMLSKTRIIAPFAGVLGTRRVSPGAYLRKGDAVTTLTQIDYLKVEFSVPERVLPYLTHSSRVTVSSPAFPEHPLEGKIDVIDPVVNPTTRSLQVLARVKNTGRRLRPGMSADVSVVLKSRPKALTVPDEAVFAQGNQEFVYVVNDDGTATSRPVTIGSRQAGTVEIVNGLAAGDKVVRAGHQKLFDGAPVVPAGAARGGGDRPPADSNQAATDSE